MRDSRQTPGEEVIALASDACGAYEEAVKRRPGKLITLRQKARVIKRVDEGLLVFLATLALARWP